MAIHENTLLYGKHPYNTYVQQNHWHIEERRPKKSNTVSYLSSFSKKINEIIEALSDPIIYANSWNLYDQT